MATVYNLSPEGVDRILLAVGPEFVPLHTYRGPNGTRVIDLAERLDVSVLNYYTAIDSRGDKVGEANVRRLELVLKTAAKLRTLVSRDPNRLSKKMNDQLMKDLGALLVRSRGEITATKEHMADPHFLGPARWKDLKQRYKMRSPFEWLAGSYLPDVFWNFYGQKPTLQRGADGKIGGPFIRFSQQVLIEFDITNSGRPFTPEAIARALTDARKQRYRAKSAG
jgi:hypothetical protein